MRLNWLLLFLLFLTSAELGAQNISFSKIAAPKNYPFTLISGMAQDSLGYIWFTSGSALYRYDGYEFKVFSNDPLNAQSLAGQSQECIFIDREGFLWTGDLYTGLNRLDPRSGIFTHYRKDSLNNSTLTSNHVSVINQDAQGNLWIGTPFGLNMMDIHTGKVTRYLNDPLDSGSLSFDDVNAIYFDKSGTMWVGTGGAFKASRDLRGGLNRFDPNTKKFTRYLHNPADPTSISDNRVKSILEDSHGNFWIGVAGKDGLNTMDRKTGKFTRYVYDPANPDKLSRPPQKKSVPYAEDHVTFIKEDIVGNIWIGTFEGGLNRYDPKSKKITHYSSSEKTDSLRENGVWSMFSARDGMLFLGGWELGTFSWYKIDPLALDFPFKSLGYPIVCFYETPQHTLYFGGYGMGVLDSEKNIQKHYTYKNNPRDSSNVNDEFVFTIVPDRKGNLWMGTNNGGVNMYDPVTGKFRYYRHDPADTTSLTGGAVSGMVEDKLGQWWISTTEGLNLMDSVTGKFKRIYAENSNEEHNLSNVIVRLYKDFSGNIWLGSIKGLSLLNINTKKMEPVFPNVAVFSLYEDSEKKLWVGTDKGLYFRKGQTRDIEQYIDMNMLPEQTAVSSIIEDDQKNLWVTGQEGIFIIDKQRSSSILHLMTLNWNTSAAPFIGVHKTQKGQLLYGTASGIYTLDPPLYTVKIPPPQFQISSFKISNKEITGSYDFKELYLDHYQNSFSVTFSSIQLRKPEDNKSMYMLEGYDNGWRKAGSERTASYFSVPPGTYTLKIATSNSTGTWSVKAIQIVITPPWWSTWWFRIAAIVGVLGTFYTVIRWRLRQKFKLELERSEKDKQLSDLRHKTSELEIHALRAQMNPHFIFNSLNSINRFILLNNKTQASEYLTKFSKLVRQIFQNSQAALISLDSELEALQLYLELEALRFDNHFQYKLIVHDDVDTSAMKVPPLIIQPYAENAIWHGLMHKEEKGNLEIELSIEGEVLLCRIKDDGIGRKRAAEIKSKANVTHKSMGMRITADRIALLQQQKLIHTAIQINDLILPDGSAGGTEIILKLPVRYD